MRHDTVSCTCLRLVAVLVALGTLPRTAGSQPVLDPQPLIETWGGSWTQRHSLKVAGDYTLTIERLEATRCSAMSR